jgi:hypothetical protein
VLFASYGPEEKRQLLAGIITHTNNPIPHTHTHSHHTIESSQADVLRINKKEGKKERERTTYNPGEALFDN